MPNIDTAIKSRINRLLNAFENDSTSPETNYTAIYLYNDGRNDRRQVTLGRGFTDDGGSLKKVVEAYIKKKGKYSENFKKHLKSFGKGILDDDQNFLKLLVAASKEDQLMRDAQDEAFDSIYWSRGIKFYQDNEFNLNLSLAIIMDSILHSGEIFMFLRNAFDESVPKSGGDERIWGQEYVKARRAWLVRKGKPLSNTVYRMDFFNREFKKKNWDFNCQMIANGSKIC